MGEYCGTFYDTDLICPIFYQFCERYSIFNNDKEYKKEATVNDKLT